MRMCNISILYYGAISPFHCLGLLGTWVDSVWSLLGLVGLANCPFCHPCRACMMGPLSTRGIRAVVPSTSLVVVGRGLLTTRPRTVYKCAAAGRPGCPSSPAPAGLRSSRACSDRSGGPRAWALEPGAPWKMAQPEAVGSFLLVGPAHHRPASCCPQSACCWILRVICGTRHGQHSVRHPHPGILRMLTVLGTHTTKAVLASAPSRQRLVASGSQQASKR